MNEVLTINAFLFSEVVISICLLSYEQMLKLPYKSIQLVHKIILVNKNWITISCHLFDTVICLLRRKSSNEEN